jgi:hypothetical protein
VVADLLWRILAAVIAWRPIAKWIVRRAQRTPYSDIYGKDGSLYMERWWLFNPYWPVEGLQQFAWLPFSIRVHHIVRPDADRHLHDHPWNARTIILHGEYTEQRDDNRYYRRQQGDTARLRFGEFHSIRYVDPHRGAYTLFITGVKRGTWGFKVPYREYLGEEA